MFGGVKSDGYLIMNESNKINSYYFLLIVIELGYVYPLSMLFAFIDFRSNKKIFLFIPNTTARGGLNISEIWKIMSLIISRRLPSAINIISNLSINESIRKTEPSIAGTIDRIHME